MADKSIVNLGKVSTPTSEDLTLLVTDVATLPTNKKSTLATFFNKIPTWLGLSTTPIVYTVGEIDVTTPVSFLSVTGSTTFSLPAGSVGQIKMLVCTVAASTPVGVLTPIASANDGYNTITFDARGQSVTLIYENSGWIKLSENGFRGSNADVMILEDAVTLGDATVSVEHDAIKAEDDTFRLALQDRTLGNVIRGTDLFGEILQSSTNSTDTVLNQFDGKEVARIHDGAVEPTQAGTSPVFSGGTGFGYRRRVLSLGSGNDDNTLTLTAADSGAIIYVTPTNAVTLFLPIVGDLTGIWFDIIIAANANKAFIIKTGNQSSEDNITSFNVATDATTADVGAANHDQLTFTNALIGSRIQLINCAGGSAEEWHSYTFTMSTIDAVIA